MNETTKTECDMKTRRIGVLFGLSGMIIMMYACNGRTSKKEYELVTEIELIREGKRLVTVLGCNDCHSSKKMTKYGPVPDENLLLSGHPMNLEFNPIDTKSADWILFSLSGTATFGPWGTSFAANLTPDNTGIGNWTIEQFTRAMREGKYKGIENGRALLPPMPWVGYKELKDSEILAMYKYLKSIKPIENIVPAPIPHSKFTFANKS